VSVSSEGTQSNGDSLGASMSRDGRFVAFESSASTLVSDDTNGEQDIFVFDRRDDEIGRVSGDFDGTEATGMSANASISADGRFVAFESGASNLVPNDTNGWPDIFVHDRNPFPAPPGPRVTNLSPAPDSTVAEVSQVVAHFDQDLDPTRITTATFRVYGGPGADGQWHTSDDPEVAGTVAYDAVTDEATFTPTGGTISVPGTYAVWLDGDATGIYSVSNGLLDGEWPGTGSAAGGFPSGDGEKGGDFWATFTMATNPERVSVASDGTQGDGPSFGAPISADGRFVAFESRATNLVPNDTNARSDVFLRDRETNTVRRVSVASDGTEGNSNSMSPSISDDGRFVAFDSYASNLVPNDANSNWDVFVHDRETGMVERVSVASDGTEGDNGSGEASISPDGQFVAFGSDASNLVPNDTNAQADIFVHDCQTDTVERVSVASDGTQGNNTSWRPSVGACGLWVAFESSASNLVPNDTNNAQDIFVYDRQNKTVERVSVASDGTQGNSDSFSPSISADGRWVAFHSQASNLIPNDTNGTVCDTFVYDRQTDTIECVSVSSDGTQGNYESAWPAISADGRFVAFRSEAENLVLDDTNRQMDVFVYDRHTETVVRVSVAADGTQGNNHSYDPSISADGRWVAFSRRRPTWCRTTRTVCMTLSSMTAGRPRRPRGRG